jgi:prophage antirepressor-like protein
MIDGEPWFVAKDVCDVLDIADPHASLRSLEDSEKGRYSMPTLGGDQSVAIISESGMYALVLHSRKPQAKPFRLWVTGEVLPAIRKTGTYISAIAANVPTTRREWLELALEQEKKIEEQHAKFLSTARPVLSMCP